MPITSSPPPNRRCIVSRRVRRLAIALSAACPLAACASTNVVTQAVALPKVAARLQKPMPQPACVVPPRATYDVAEIEAARACEAAAGAAARARLHGLQRAVAVREAAAAKAVAAGQL